MTVHEFLDEVQGYYGQYNGTQKKYVQAWLEARRQERLPAILRHVLSGFSATLRMPPGIRELEAALALALEEASLAARSKPVPREGKRADPEQMEKVAEMLHQISAQLSAKTAWTPPLDDVRK
jgi:hypothetical protein